MVWILNCSFKFSTSTLVFKLLNSTFLFDLVRCTFSTRQTNFYTLLLFISFDAWSSTLHLSEMPVDSHSPHFACHRVKFQTQRRILFSTQFSNFCLRFSDHWSRQKKSLWGWEMATYRPPPPALYLGNTPPQAKILLALLKRKAF